LSLPGLDGKPARDKPCPYDPRHVPIYTDGIGRASKLAYARRSHNKKQDRALMLTVKRSSELLSSNYLSHILTGTPGLKCPIIHSVRRAEG